MHRLGIAPIGVSGSVLEDVLPVIVQCSGVGGEPDGGLEAAAFGAAEGVSEVVATVGAAGRKPAGL